MQNMEYTKEYKVKDEHIDVQGIMDGLYYPFYMEDCRHRFAKEVMGFDIEQEALKGINMVLSQYTIKFLRPLRKDDNFTVTCCLYSDKDGKPKFYLKQRIMMNNKIMTEGVFTATCVPATGGRPFVPENLIPQIQASRVLEGLL